MSNDTIINQHEINRKHIPSNKNKNMDMDNDKETNKIVENLEVLKYYNETDDSDSSDVENEDKITLIKFLAEVEDIDDIRGMFIGMILDLKERIKGCEQCETCSEVIKIIDKFIIDYKKIYKLAEQMANLVMQFIISKKVLKLSPNQNKLLEFIFIIIMKNSSFTDLEYIYNCFPNLIDINMFNGLAIKLSIQKYNRKHIEKILTWGADITIQNHRAIVKAFYHERFPTIKLLMEHGSSYKYYLMSELEDNEYEYVYKEIQKIINNDLPDNIDIDELTKEYKFLDILIKYIIIRTNKNKKDTQLDDIDFIYDFIEHLNINLDNQPEEHQKIEAKKIKKREKKKLQKARKQLKKQQDKNINEIDNTIDNTVDNTIDNTTTISIKDNIEKDYGFEFDLNDYNFNYYYNHFKRVFNQYSPECKFIHYSRIQTF